MHLNTFCLQLETRTVGTDTSEPQSEGSIAAQQSTVGSQDPEPAQH
jgi:hypothetical protein